MKRLITLVIIVLFSSLTSFGQGIVRGRVIDKSGETLIGVTIMLNSNHAVGTSTDFDGNYSIDIKSPGEQVLVFSYVSYKSVEVTVNPINGKVIDKDVVMESSAMEFKQVEVAAKAVKGKEYYTEMVKKNAATTIDYVSSETMKKTGDASVVAAVSRVSGVSTNGSFITVRGIGDRYVKTSLNGSIIPTLDPFTNNIKLDLFPSSLIDNVFITKTASPDIPGDWAGAFLSVETKDYPEKLSVNIESSLGYNSQSTFKDIVTSDHSSSDWLGYDNGLRDVDHNNFNSAIITPSTYQEFVALGLGDYYSSLGVNGNAPWNDTYYKLGLIQLGLLAPGQINDVDAFNAAKLEYLKGPYKSNAFSILNAGVPATGAQFSDSWNSIKKKAPLNFSQSFSIGNQTKLFGKPLGFIVGLKYNSAVVSDPSSVSNKAAIADDGNGNLVNTVSSSVKQDVTRESNGWSALFNVAYKYDKNNSVSLMFMPNYIGVNNVRSSVDDREPANYVVTKSQFYEQRRQLIYQLKSENYFPKLKLKLEGNASYTNGNSSAPDFKNVQYYKDPITNTYQIGGTIGDGVHRYYRYLSDDLFDSRLFGEFPLGNKPGLPRKLKLGGSYTYNYKESDQYDYEVNFGPAAKVLTNEDLNEYFNFNTFDIQTSASVDGVTSSTFQHYYTNDVSPANHIFGRSNIYAGYVMSDYSITERLRASGGVRVEQAKIYTDVVKFDSLNLPANDPRRDYKEGFPAANPGKLDELSVLPSVNLVYKLRYDEDAPLNVRLNYSWSVARPSIRELSDVAAYDYEYRAFVFGNSDLKMVKIKNYDLRLENYFKSGDNLSLSVFYKDFKNHIELVNSAGISWQNVDKSKVMGIELEGRKKINEHFEFRANVTFAKSETEFVRTRMEVTGGVKNFIPQDTITRPMFGQAPYVINGILSYAADSIGLNVSLTYNVQGARLVVAADVKEVPDIYELPRNIFDVKVSKKLGPHFGVSFTVKDILNTPVRRSYDYEEGYTLDYDKYTYGTNYILSLNYKL